MRGRSTCVDEYVRFVAIVARHVKRGVRTPAIAYDGATAHTSARAIQAVEQHFEPLQQAPYSSPFNPVETVWSLARRNFQKRQLLHEGYIDWEDFVQMVDESCQQITPTQLRGVLRSHHAHIRKYLQLAVN